MQQEREGLHERLEEELSGIHFNQTDQVLQRTHPRTWGQRIRAVWNREVELPLLPIGMLAVLVIGITMQQHMHMPSGRDTTASSRQLIEVGGNIYWVEAYSKAVKNIAH